MEDTTTFSSYEDSSSSALQAEDLRRPLSSIMKPAITAAIDATVQDAILLMQRNRIGCVLVVSHRKLLGIFTERDVLKKIVGSNYDIRSTPLGEVMTINPQALNEDDTIAYALNFLDLGGYRHIPIVNDLFEPIGLVSVKAIVSYLVQYFADEILSLPPHRMAIQEDETDPSSDDSTSLEDDEELSDGML